MDTDATVLAAKCAPPDIAVGGGGILTLLRHGRGEPNRGGHFTGWTDVELSEAGEAEAERAGRMLARSERPVDVCYTSMLRRATRTSEIVLRAMGRQGVAIQQTWRLNERHYGALQGLGTWSAVSRFGPLTVMRCRRKFRARPPVLLPGDPRDPGSDPHYAHVPGDALPHGESLADTQARLLPYWREHIVPDLLRGRHVLVVSHKNTLRALLRLLRHSAPDDVPRFSVTNGTPMVMTFEPSDHRILQARGDAIGMLPGDRGEPSCPR